MAIAQFPTKKPILLTPFWGTDLDWPAAPTNTTTLDAAGESIALIGRVHMEAGAGTTKTISAAGGGKIWWRSGGTVTFADGSTNLRIGINDVSAATGVEDGTHDVYADLVGGTDAISTNTVYGTAMETGTKTMTHGDIIAAVIEMTGRGGSDSVQIARTNSSVAGNFPYSTVDSGAGPAKFTVFWLCVAFEFDDGTMGWIECAPSFVASTGGTALATFGNGSTPDEYGLVWSLPFGVQAIGMAAYMGNLASGDDFDLVYYSDPLGTPSSDRSVSVDPDILALGSGWVCQPWATSITIAANAVHCLSVLPTTANSVALHGATFADAKLRRQLILGENSRLGTRSNVTGAFAETTTSVPYIGLLIDGFHNGAGYNAPIIGPGGLAY